MCYESARQQQDEYGVHNASEVGLKLLSLYSQTLWLDSNYFPILYTEHHTCGWCNTTLYFLT